MTEKLEFHEGMSRLSSKTIKDVSALEAPGETNDEFEEIDITFESSERIRIETTDDGYFAVVDYTARCCECGAIVEGYYKDEDHGFEGAQPLEVAEIFGMNEDHEWYCYECCEEVDEQASDEEVDQFMATTEPIDEEEFGDGNPIVNIDEDDVQDQLEKLRDDPDVDIEEGDGIRFVGPKDVMEEFFGEGDD